MVVNGPDRTVVLREPDGSQRKLPNAGNPSVHGHTVSDDGTRITETLADGAALHSGRF